MIHTYIDKMTSYTCKSDEHQNDMYRHPNPDRRILVYIALLP
jgi:hypothetical protein